MSLIKAKPIVRALLRPVFILIACGIAACVALAHDTERLQRLIAQRFGSEASARYNDWREVIQQAASAAEADKLPRVNEFFNRRVRFVDDQQIWGRADYWASPLEFLGHGAGDCEDFSIAKYFSLIEAGVERGKLRLIYVRAVIGLPGSGVPVAHMVLGYYATPVAEPLVLDNLVTEIRPASRRPDLTPVFSFNGEGVWTATGVDRPGMSVERLARWTELVQRMRGEGFEP